MNATNQLRNYAVVTGAYWGFTLTDGALRMLVLLYFHRLGYSPFQLALLFVLYELFGAITNLVGGFIGARLGLKITLFVGLALQVVALGMLSGLSPGWPQTAQIVYVLLAQGLSGVAKDFTKLSAKSAIKILLPADAHGRLFRWVAILTGSKNALKGLGFFLGGLLLHYLGFRAALWAMAGCLVVVLVAAGALLPSAIGKARAKVSRSDILSKTRAINVLSAARMFLFCARDVWFVVALPVFLTDVLGWSFVGVGSYMAAWVVGYGIIQTATPKILPRLGGSGVNDAKAAQIWGFALAVVPFALFAVLRAEVSAEAAVVGGLGIFGVLFAINSSVHSYLILAYTDRDKVALNVGFYYMANAVGRLIGTLLSGVMYQWGGLEACLVTAGTMVVLASGLSLALPDPRPQQPATVSNVSA